MTKKIFIMVMVVVVAIFIGVTITVQNVNDPLLRRVVKQQDELLERMRALDKQLGIVYPDDLPVKLDGGQHPLAVALPKDDVKRLEMKIDALAKLVARSARGGQAARQARPKDDLTTVHDIEIGSSKIMGEKDAPITIVSFVDLECPFSAKFQPVINEVVKTYPKKVKQVMKNFPLAFHKQGMPAAKAAMAAGEQGKYWEMIDLILQNQRKLGDEKYKELASDLGLNVERFTNDYEGKGAEWEEMFKADVSLGSKVGVRGTPTYYFNGRKTLSRTVEAFKKEIEAALNGENK